eukprot:9469015-Pyramimonas_sp.AAC.1
MGEVAVKQIGLRTGDASAMRRDPLTPSRIVDAMTMDTLAIRSLNSNVLKLRLGTIWQHAPSPWIDFHKSRRPRGSHSPPRSPPTVEALT